MVVEVHAKPAGLTLVEVTVAFGLMAATVLGVAATFSVAQKAQVFAKEREAASIACVSVLDDIADWQFDNIVTSWNQVGFHVNCSSSQVGLETGSPPGVRKLPAAPLANSLWPASRAASTADKSMAGYVEVTSVAGRTNLLQATATVVWQSPAGGNQRAVYQFMVTE